MNNEFMELCWFGIWIHKCISYQISYNMPRGNLAGAMYCFFAGTPFLWPVPPAQPASSVCVVTRSYHEWGTRRNPAELYRALQVDQFAVRGSEANSTLRIIEFAKDLKGFRETQNQLRQELSTAVCGNRGEAVFLRFSMVGGWFLRWPSRSAWNSWTGAVLETLICQGFLRVLGNPEPEVFLASRKLL